MLFVLEPHEVNWSTYYVSLGTLADKIYTPMISRDLQVKVSIAYIVYIDIF